MEIELYNHKLKTRGYYCQLNDCLPSCVDEPYINLYIKMSGCNARCEFCNDDCVTKPFDLNKLCEIMREIKSKVKIRKISFTGGEPTLNIQLLEIIFNIVKQSSPDSFTVINTNGFNLKGIFESSLLRYINSVSLSRHHYKDELNQEITGVKSVATKNTIIELGDNCSKIHLSCNLIKNYIDNAEEIRHYLENANLLGIHDIGFVSLMGLNDYCKENYVDSKIIDEVKGIIKTKEWKYKDCCECSNYFYLPDNYKNGVLSIYHRHAKSPMDFVSMLMFDGEFLREGFNGKVIT